GERANRIQIKLTNAWGENDSSKVARVYYRRPPNILKLTQVAVPGKPNLTLTAEVFSPLPLLRDRDKVEVKVNGTDSPPARVLITEAGDNRYTVRLEEVELEGAWKGRKVNDILVRLSNKEGESNWKGTRVESESVLPRPEVHFLTRD